MTPEPALYVVIGAVIVLLAMLLVVVIARSMDAPAAAKPPTAPEEASASTGMAELMKLGSLEGLMDVAKKAGASSHRQAPAHATAHASQKAPDAKKVSTPLSIIAGAVAVIGAAAAIAGGIFDDDAPPIESEITAGALQGAFLDTGDGSEVVLIVPGSGPTDRNGDSPAGISAQPYRLLAEGLAAEGISSVRVDKRGMFGSAAAGDPNAVSIAVYAEDYRAWIDAIRARTGVDCVWLLGHSEGALMVSAAAQGRKDVCGLILVSGMGRRMGDVIRAQLHANPANAPLLDAVMHALSELEAGRRLDVAEMHPALGALFAPAVQDYLIDVLPADPVKVLRDARKKTLIIQGTTDLQTTLEDARLLNKAPRTSLERIRGMNHVLKDAPLDRAANMATYANPDLPLSDDLIDEIESFIDGD